MKQYGEFKATEFTKKQIGVIYSKAKAGELKVEKWYMSRLYDMADYYGYDSNRGVENEERYIQQIINAVFDGNLSDAQELIDHQQDKVYELMGRKAKAGCRRDLLVK